MKACKTLVVSLICLFALGSGQAKSKKPKVSEAFQHARYVYVDSLDADPFKPSLHPQDREAVHNVQEALQGWSRYVLTQRREEADLVFAVRKGRMLRQGARDGIESRTPSDQAGSIGPGGPAGTMHTRSGTPVPSMPEAEASAPTDFGAPVDLMRVYILKPDGKLLGPVWSQQMEYGLNAPEVKLLRELQTAVDKSYPTQ